MKRKIITLLIIIIIVSIVVIKVNGGKTESAAKSRGNLGIVTKVLIANEGQLARKIKYVGTIDSEKTINISPMVTADIIELNISEGDLVEKGDLIARLDNIVLSNNLDTVYKKLETMNENYYYLNLEAKEFYSTGSSVKKIENLEYEYTFMKDKLIKYSVLYEEGAISESEYDKIIHDRDVAGIQLDEARASTDNQYEELVHERDAVQMQIKEIESQINGVSDQINETLLIAPESGIVRKLYYEAGDMALTGKPFATIDANGFVVRVNIAESDLKKLSLSTKILLKITDELTYEGGISRFPTSINPETRIGEIEIEIYGDVGNINMIIGSSVEVSFITQEVSGEIILPQKAIKAQGEDDFVYIVEDGIIRKQEVELGIKFEEMVQVIEGVSSGEVIAYDNLSKLYQGAKVYVFEGAE